jgi:tRNA dimethylallyltransferase
VAELLSEDCGARIPTVVVDSMQVYREIPQITNQARRRPAELVGVVSVSEEWTVARHRDLVRDLIPDRAVLDAGTGMYLNAILLDIPLAPKVPPALRALAQASTAPDAANRRRAVRARELELAGVAKRGSVWEGDLLYDVEGIYLRPERSVLDCRIEARSKEIVLRGREEAEELVTTIEAGMEVSPSVLDSIGVREMMDLARGGIPAGEAAARIAARTRRLARRQVRWFDKLAKTLEGRASLQIVQDSPDFSLIHSIHDIMES